jgi:rare lipoprotein A
MRRGLTAAFAAGLTFAAGCHKKAQAPPPPPPPQSRSSGTSQNRPPAKPRPVLPPDNLKDKPVLTEVGFASWYGAPYKGAKAANGTVFDENALTAAHRTLPMGTTVRVTNLATNQSVIATITDRGPFVPGRVLDLSMAAAKETGVYRAGIAKVKIEAWPHNTTDPAGRWCVQIGAFLTEEDAVQLKNELLHKYPTAKVIQFAGPTGHWVRINPVKPGRQPADKIAEAIRVPDAEPYVVRLN